MSAAAVDVVAVEDADGFWEDTDALRACLTEPVPRIPPWFGYDERGSELFEAITELPTYYLTRVEWDLLRRHGAEIAEQLGCGRVAELGSGSAKKTRLLLGECASRRATTYLPVDVSREMLEASAAALRDDVPELAVTGLWGRYEAALDHLHDDGGAPLAVMFLGGNLGNTTPQERDALLARIAATLRPGDAFLVSADLLKPTETFETCYNDPPGHSAFAEFRLNHLAHLTRRFGGDADLSAFVPHARFDERAGVVEGHLWAVRDEVLSLPGLGVTRELRRGDGVNVGFSAKFDRDRFVADVAAHGMTFESEWSDPHWRYGIFLFRR
ncbi:L-histidine N(alpha)-methyltransferase [Pseudonocardia sp. KRD291]|uniref:L-histidine N(alpha)-methyltransferase n=1 Tax=Pseudonocardia sp. KRD291 TaxID=2792007 RepID=UPI001C49CF19|nr:L-histidine N(alpha)-methyltransferase [Pseudonocardia sp. KRD291]MBW0103968.1 L-histidine N(alpha)-methyltransferase [Pseudonocardia sp. KRD291]